MSKEYENSIRFLFEEIQRYKEIPIREWQHKPTVWDIFATIPGPNGGDITYGNKARTRLFEATQKAIKNSAYEGRLDPADALKELERVISFRFLVERRALNQQQCQKAFNTALRKAAKSMEAFEHFIPVQLTDDSMTDSFSIGPVSFFKTQRALEIISDEEKEQQYTAEHQLEIRQKLRQSAMDYYSKFSWTASISVEECSQGISDRIAEYRVERAIDCLHLLIGVYHSGKIMVGGPGLKVDKRATLKINSAGKTEISESVSWNSPSLKKSWWEDLSSQPNFDHILNLLGQTIEMGSSLSSTHPLAQRLLDAIQWFGEAVRDKLSSSKIIKYVTAIERLVVTGKKDGDLTKTIGRRGAALALAYYEDSYETKVVEFEKLYATRSKLVHGSISPSSLDLQAIEHQAEQLASRVIMCCAAYFDKQGLQDQSYSTQNLEESFSDLEKWAIAQSQ